MWPQLVPFHPASALFHPRCAESRRCHRRPARAAPPPAASSTSLTREASALRVRVASRRVKMPPEGLGYPALREPRPRRAILALAPALEGQVQDAFIATHPRGGGFVALLAAARAGPPGRGGATGPRSGPRPASASSATSRQTRWSVPMQNSPDLPGPRPAESDPA